MKLKPDYIIVIALICILGSACEPAPPMVNNGMPDETSSPTAIPEPTLPETMLLRIRLATTSDWTNLSLVSGAAWQRSGPISADAEVTTADMHDNQLVLDQPLGQALAGEGVEMIVEVLLSAQEMRGPVVFKIERGDIGSTQVEFSRYVDEEWLVIRTISWGGITGDGINAYSIEIPVEELFGELAAVISTQQAPGAIAVAPVTGMPQGTDGYPWWNDSIFYEIFVRSFNDSDGDGTGDLNGITQKLDYLNDGDPDTSTDLGITGIWLMPIYPSPTYHGYNVTDYYAVNPEYGTMDDFIDLLDAAHARGIRVILDLTLNQTSYQHPWFINSGNPASSYHDWYIWSDHNPGYTGSWGQQVWFPYNGLYYYSTFSMYSPDLNHNNPEVYFEMQEVVRFWLEDVGVDGFRLDAAKHLIEEGTIQANSASTHAWWERFRLFYKGINPQAFTVGEIWEHTSINAEYLQGDEFDLSFEFSLSYEIIDAINNEDSGIVNEQVELSYGLIPPLQFATFLTNHDQDRLLSQLGNDPPKVMVAASLLLTAPGVPFIYYGEEIGMEGQKPDEHIRRPMQWSVDPFAGFSTIAPWQPLGPGWEYYNVATETGDPTSILSHYRNLIHARNQHAALRVGDLSVLTTGNDSLYAILRVSQQETVLVLINLTGEAVTDYALGVEQSSLAEGSYTPFAILGAGEFAPVSTNSTGGFTQYVPADVIPPHATFILQLRLNAP